MGWEDALLTADARRGCGHQAMMGLTPHHTMSKDSTVRSRYSTLRDGMRFRSAVPCTVLCAARSTQYVLHLASCRYPSIVWREES